MPPDILFHDWDWPVDPNNVRWCLPKTRARPYRVGDKVMFGSDGFIETGIVVGLRRPRFVGVKPEGRKSDSRY